MNKNNNNKENNNNQKSNFTNFTRKDGYSKITEQSVAPYNFVPLPANAKVISKDIKELQSHGEINKKKNSGYIEYEIENITPLIIGKGKEDKNDKNVYFFKNDKGEYTIPGSTIRGLLRNNASILSFSNVSEDIEDGRFYFRSFGIDKLGRDYKERIELKTKPVNGEQMLMPHRVKTGYIYIKSQSEYELIPSKKINGLPYLVIKEQYLRRIAPKDLPINYMYTEEIDELIKNKDKYSLTKAEKDLPEDKKKKIAREKQYKKANFLKDIKNRNFRLSAKPLKVSYEISGARTISKIGHIGEFKNEGFLLTSNYISKKLVHYIIPCEKDTNLTPVVFKKGEENYKYIEYYNDDLVRTKKARIEEGGKIILQKNYEYYGLPSKVGYENGKPIFYGEYKGNYFFGFTPYLRVPYDNNLKNGINDNYKNLNGFSYIDKLFGFASKENNYKGLLSFEDCIYENSQTPKFSKTYNVILGEPHPTSYNLYLKQDINGDKKEIINYNDSFEIRGIKQYWIKNYVTESEIKENSKVDSILHPIDKGSSFKGKIHFTNLSNEELGLLLWALKVENNAHENIGMGKPFGFGHIVIKGINLKLEDYENKYLSMSVNCFKDGNKEKFIEAYKKSLGDKINSKPIKDFILIKTNVIEEKDKNKFRYMEIEFIDNNNKNNEFTKFEPLPNISEQIEILSGKKIIEKKETTTTNNKKNNSYNNKKDNKFGKGSNNNNKSSKSSNKKGNKRVYEDEDNGNNAMAEAYKKAQDNKKKKEL